MKHWNLFHGIIWSFIGFGLWLLLGLRQFFFYDFLFFAEVAPLKHILKPIHPDVG
jgi:hypothetical protein